jgi:hypothetical protein
MRELLKRLQEPSSYVAIGGMLIIFGIEIAPEVWDKVIEGAGALSFLVGLLLKERGGG